MSWGSRQGIRVYDATNVLIYRNTLFRNENAGVYFAAGSGDGIAIANVAWENVKGLRWSSQSNFALALDNVAFDNSERGIALENVEGAVLRRNVLVNNRSSQLLALRATFNAEDDCFGLGGPDQLVADFSPAERRGRYTSLAAYREAKRQDLQAREGCDALPPKMDVGRLHAEYGVCRAGASHVGRHHRNRRGAAGRDEARWRLARVAHGSIVFSRDERRDATSRSTLDWRGRVV